MHTCVHAMRVGCSFFLMHVHTHTERYICGDRQTDIRRGRDRQKETRDRGRELAFRAHGKRLESKIIWLSFVGLSFSFFLGAGIPCDVEGYTGEAGQCVCSPGFGPGPVVYDDLSITGGCQGKLFISLLSSL